MRLMLVADKYNARFYGVARNTIEGHTITYPKAHYSVLAMYVDNAKRNNIDAIILSNDVLLAKLVKKQTGKDVPLKNNRGKPTHPSNNWAGACFVVEGIKIIISLPFSQLVKRPYAPFLLRWYCNKHLDHKFPKPTSPVPSNGEGYTVLRPYNVQEYYEMFKDALYIAVDIETQKQPVSELALQRLRDIGKPVDGISAKMKLTKGSKKLVEAAPIIDMIGYCGLFKDEDGNYFSHSIVLHIETMDDIKWMRAFNKLEAPKICQNGGYEGTYLIRYNAPLYNWLCDTFHYMHCWYAELPRTLDFIASMFLTNFQYWKDEIESKRAEYNAKDTYVTLWSWIFMVNLSPQWAKDNYLIEFRKCFPAITSGLEGFKIDADERARLREQYQTSKDATLASLEKILWEGFNPSSPAQVLTVMNAFSLTRFKSSDEKAMRRFSEQGPLQAHIVELILRYRGDAKKLSTYINATEFDGRLLYEINHGGTDTGRAASKASNLWVGTQIQNIDNSLRTMYIADDGYLIANCDGSQAESRTTAYLSEDEVLMDTVETAPDFHTRNASLFFGIPEDEIVKPVYETVVRGGVEVQIPKLDDEGKPIKDKSIRTLSKRVNHGANYNMGAAVLLETMGMRNVFQAKEILNLPKHYGAIAVCNYLLQTFSDTYPDVKGKYYDEVIEEIRITSMLRGPTGWTRYCFEVPSKQRNKPVLNKYVAHPSQSLSVMMVDEAEFDFWYEWQIKRGIVRLKAQVHDEVVYMVKPEHYEQTKPALAKLMARPVEVKGRTLVIPNDGGSADPCWGNLKD